MLIYLIVGIHKGLYQNNKDVANQDPNVAGTMLDALTRTVPVTGR